MALKFRRLYFLSIYRVFFIGRRDLPARAGLCFSTGACRKRVFFSKDRAASLTARDPLRKRILWAPKLQLPGRVEDAGFKAVLVEYE